MRALFEHLGGLWELARLGATLLLRSGGPYLRWRMETAFGSRPERRPPLRQRIQAMLEYGRWVHRMKRGG